MPSSLLHRAARALLPGLLLLALPGTARSETGDWLGTEVCSECHREEATAWRGSHHDLAMQAPTAATVLGDFNDARFLYNEIETRFYRDGDDYRVRTDGPDGTMRDYRVAWVFGVYPLQQLLLPLEGGRLQALSIAWDARPAAEGGQRWYHLYPDEAIDHRDPLHWTGPYQNWNTRCAECHSTDLHKGYDARSRRFETRFAGEDVGCEACHGPGAKHVRRARAGEAASGADSGLWALGERGTWAFREDAPIAARQAPLADPHQVTTCGRCHARRGSLGDYRHGQPLSDTHRLALLGQPLYHHDGQILDEVYVYGSFLQSRMHGAGVVCSNCHEPHSLALRAPGNGVCAQCHRSDVYDGPAHHHHETGTGGSQCVDCHMPARRYMGVDDRRDHSLRIPRPDLSASIGTPNACNDCHDDRDAFWALGALRDWGVTFRDTARHPALAMEAAQRGDIRALPRLLELADDPRTATIWRATALERSAALDREAALTPARALLDSPEALLRVSAVRSLAALPLRERFALLYPLRADAVRGVRLEVAQALAAAPFGQLDAAHREGLRELFREYLEVQATQADMPATQLQLARFHLDRGDLPAAEAAYREALRINPQLVPGRLNLADLLRAQGREDEAREQLQAAVAAAPENGDALHALGLLHARAGRQEAALDLLRRAAEQKDSVARHRFVFAIALHDYGQTDAALRVLSALHRALPADEQTLLALANYSAEAGDRSSALRHARTLVELAPANTAYRRLLAALENRG